MRESAAEENMLSALSGIRNTIDQSDSLRAQLAAKDAEIARWKNQTMDARQLARDQHAEIARLRRALRRVRKNIPEGALTAFEIIADALDGNVASPLAAPAEKETEG